MDAALRDSLNEVDAAPGARSAEDDDPMEGGSWGGGDCTPDWSVSRINDSTVGLCDLLIAPVGGGLMQAMKKTPTLKPKRTIVQSQPPLQQPPIIRPVQELKTSSPEVKKENVKKGWIERDFNHKVNLYQHGLTLLSDLFLVNLDSVAHSNVYKISERLADLHSDPELKIPVTLASSTGLKLQVKAEYKDESGIGDMLNCGKSPKEKAETFTKWMNANIEYRIDLMEWCKFMHQYGLPLMGKRKSPRKPPQEGTQKRKRVLTKDVPVVMVNNTIILQEKLKEVVEEYEVLEEDEIEEEDEILEEEIVEEEDGVAVDYFERDGVVWQCREKDGEIVETYSLFFDRLVRYILQ